MIRGSITRMGSEGAATNAVLTGMATVLAVLAVLAILAVLLGGCAAPRRTSHLVCRNPLGMVTYDRTIVNDVWYFRDGRWATTWGDDAYRPAYYESCEARTAEK